MLFCAYEACAGILVRNGHRGIGRMDGFSALPTAGTCAITCRRVVRARRRQAIARRQGPARSPLVHVLADGEVHCQLCPNSCRLSDGQIGRCRARQNIGGKLYSLVYGKVAALHVDPIEKKPFFTCCPASAPFP